VPSRPSGELQVVNAINMKLFCSNYIEYPIVVALTRIMGWNSMVPDYSFITIGSV
jgi:hypothetical protein